MQTHPPQKTDVKNGFSRSCFLWPENTIFAAIFLIINGLSACKQIAPLEEKKKQSGYGSSVLPLEFIAALRLDAAYLSLRDIKLGKENFTDVATLPPELIAKNHALLIRIHELAFQNPAIPQIRKIHHFPNPDLKAISVTLKPDCSFLNSWRKGYTMTDDLFLNELISHYLLSVKNFKDLPPFPTAELISVNYLNTPELARSVAKADGVKSAEAKMVAGDGDKIIKYGTEELTKVTFSHGYTDCASGCINRTYFNFEIRNGNNISYTGTTGDPVELNW